MFMNSDLSHAAYKGETQKVLDILGKKTGSDTVDEYMALYKAVSGGQIETAKAILHLYVPQEARQWLSVLSAAAAISLEMLTLLVEKIQDPDVPLAKWLAGRVFYYNYNSLISAAHGGNPQMIEYFLAQGAGVDYENDLGKTALFYAAGEDAVYAAQENTKEAVRLLLDRGAVINHKDKEGNTALFSSILNRNRETPLELLERGAEVSLFNIHNLSPLRAALKYGRVKLADRLIRYGASLSETDTQGLTTRDWTREISIPGVGEWLSKQP